MLIWLQLFSSFWMLAVIWFVQLVHYPLFAHITFNDRIEYSKKHQQAISFIVMPAMLIELISLLLMQHVFGQTLWYLLIICLVIIWGSTFLLQVPCHQRLLHNPTNQVIDRLVKTNWIRTLTWTVKTILIGFYVFSYLL